MARRLVWSPEAIEDIESIAEYIERDSLWYARSVARKIVEKQSRFLQTPKSEEWLLRSAILRSAIDSSIAIVLSIESKSSAF